MIIDLSNNAKNILEQSIEDKDSKFLAIKMVKYDCNGAVLSMSLTSNNDGLEIFEQDGFKFLMSDEEAEMFDRISVDYESEGLSQGFIVNPVETKLDACFPSELEDVE